MVKLSMKPSVGIVVAMLWVLGSLRVSAEPLHLDILTEEFPPYNYQQDDGVRGLSVEVVQEMLRRVKASGLELSHQMKLYPWLRAYKLATEKPNTAIFSIGRNAKREELFHWVGVIAPAQFYLFSLNGREEVDIENLDDAKAFRVGTFPKSVREQYLLEQGFELDRNIISIYDYPRLFDLLYLGRIDLWAMNEMLAYHIAREKGHDPKKVLNKALFLSELSPEGYYLAFNKGTDPRIVKAFDQALADMHKDGTYQKILDSYLAH